MDNMMKNSEMEELMNGSEESKESFSNNLFMNQHHENRNMDESDEVTSSDCLNNYMPKYEGLSIYVILFLPLKIHLMLKD